MAAKRVAQSSPLSAVPVQLPDGENCAGASSGAPEKVSESALDGSDLAVAYLTTALDTSTRSREVTDRAHSVAVTV